MAKAVGVRVPPFAEREPSVKDEKLPSTIKELNVKVPEEAIKRKREEILKYFKAKASIHGFRPGNAPLEIVERVFKEEIKERVTDELINEYGRKAINESGFTPLNAPVVKEYSYGDDGSLLFSIIFEVIPSYDVVDYIGIEVELKKTIVQDKDVENALQSLRENYAQLVPVEDRGVQNGDIVELEVQKFIVPEKRALPVERYIWQIEKEVEDIPGLFENVMGMRVGEEKKFRILYPEEFHKKNLRGKEIETRVKIVTIKEKRLPELTDEFVSKIGDYKNLEDLKEKLRQKIMEEVERKEREIIENEVLRVLRERNPVEVPRTLENAELERLARSFEVRGEIEEEERERLIHTLRDIANSNVKNYLLLSKISEKEGLKVDKHEVETELRRATDLSSLSLNEIEKLRKDIEKRLILKKTLDFIISKAIIKYKEEN